MRQVQRLADSLQIDGASASSDTSGAGYTCEAAAFFHLYHVTSRVEQFKAALSEVRNLCMIITFGLSYRHHMFVCIAILKCDRWVVCFKIPLFS